MRHLPKLCLLLLLLSLTAAANSMGRKEAPERHGPLVLADTTQATPQPGTGITGKVEIWEGNFMPPVDPQNPRGKITPGAKRRVRAHAPVTMAGGLASARRDSVPTPLVAEAVTDSSGQFFLSVPPGTYSVFVEEDSAWYFNGWNGEGIQGAVIVAPEKPGEILIKVTTKATF